MADSDKTMTVRDDNKAAIRTVTYICPFNYKYELIDWYVGRFGEDAKPKANKMTRKQLFAIWYSQANIKIDETIFDINYKTQREAFEHGTVTRDPEAEKRFNS